MKAPLEWLSAYVQLPDSLDELVQRLIMSGTEVEDIINPAESWQDIVVGHVLSKEIPEGSRHLSVVNIDIGPRTIVAVTGAPNIEPGQMVPVVLLGGTVPVGPEGEPFLLQPRKMLGITGEGMVMSERELGLSQEHAGILVLPGSAQPGKPLSEVIGAVVLDVEAKGRPDTQSMLGVARELAAITKRDLKQPETGRPDTVQLIEEPSATVRIDAPDLCPRFSVVRIDGIRIVPSPEWLASRLEAAGVRSINNVVDVTNYVMLELGQPLHAYDAGAVPDATFIIRRAEPGEKIATLDDVERTLTNDMVVVADRQHATGIGGVMGGGDSEIKDSTTAILLEAANWDRVNIRKTSRNLGLRTEASGRFEKGVPVELTSLALERSINLLSQVNPEPLTIHSMVDVKTPPPAVAPIQFRPERIARILGVSVDEDQVLDSLRRLGFAVSADDGLIQATPPFWRKDVEGVADIAEEIARMIGYDFVPESLPGQEVAPPPLPQDLAWENAVRRTLWGVGLSEAWTDTLSSPEAIHRFGPLMLNPAGISNHGATTDLIRLANAPSSERSVVRNSLIPALLDIASRNLKHTHEGVAFFEIARTFFRRREDLPYERRTVSIVLAGDRELRSWNGPQIQFDFFDLKGVVEAVLALFLPGQRDCTFLPISGDRLTNLSLHPGRAAAAQVGDKEVGVVGEVHPTVADRFEIEDSIRAYVAELDLDTLMSVAKPQAEYRAVSRFPSVRRDIAVVFPDAVEASSVIDIVASSGGDLLRDVRIVDVYTGANLEPGHRSIALSLEFQSERETLTQEAVSAIQDRIVAELSSRFDGVLRA